MRSKRLVFGCLVAAVLCAAPAFAAEPQHEHGQAQEAQPKQPGMGMMQRCMQEHERMMSSMSQLISEMEQARKSDDPARMRSALDRATREMRQMQARMQANMQMMQGMMSGMMGGGAGMTGAQDGLRARLESACGHPLDPDTAPRATYRGRLYYFCSPEDQKRFERDPERFLRERGLH